MTSSLPTSLQQATLPQIMKRSLAHLPKHKQQELKEITSITKANPGVEMVILFGSYARGDWVEDVYTEGHITYEYKSDFDILVIVKNRQYARRIMTWDRVKSAINHCKTINTWATLIVHDINEVNKALSRGRYFFTDIKQDHQERVRVFGGAYKEIAEVDERGMQSTD